mgnify:CR=1 FL=1
MKKIISLLLVVSMLFAFASCSPKDNEELTTTESTEIGEVVSTTEETTEKTDVLVLGVDASLVPYEYMNGDEVVGIEPYWTIICDFKDALNIECENDWIKIGIDNDLYIDEDFKIVLADKENQYTSDLMIRIESLL